MIKYLVLAMRTSAWSDDVIEPHRQWLASVRDAGQLDCTGRFPDGSGGAYVVLAENLGDARELVFTDPIHTSGASDLTVYEWEITG